MSNLKFSILATQKKARAGEAYKVYDRLGNVFVNDGIYGAIDGVSDYIQSIMSSPSTYIVLSISLCVSLFIFYISLAFRKVFHQRFDA